MGKVEEVGCRLRLFSSTPCITLGPHAVTPLSCMTIPLSSPEAAAGREHDACRDASHVGVMTYHVRVFHDARIRRRLHAARSQAPALSSHPNVLHDADDDARTPRARPRRARPPPANSGAARARPTRLKSTMPTGSTSSGSEHPTTLVHPRAETFLFVDARAVTTFRLDDGLDTLIILLIILLNIPDFE